MNTTQSHIRLPILIVSVLAVVIGTYIVAVGSIKPIPPNGLQGGRRYLVFPYVSPNHQYIALSYFGKNKYIRIIDLSTGHRSFIVSDVSIFNCVAIPWFFNSTNLLVGNIQNDKYYYYIISRNGHIVEKVKIPSKYDSDANAEPSVDGRNVAFSASSGIKSYACIWSLRKNLLHFIKIPEAGNISYISWLSTNRLVVFFNLTDAKGKTNKTLVYMLYLTTMRLQSVNFNIKGNVTSFSGSVSPYANIGGIIAIRVKYENSQQLMLYGLAKSSYVYINLPEAGLNWRVKWINKYLIALWTYRASGKLEIRKYNIKSRLMSRPILFPPFAQESIDSDGTIWFWYKNNLYKSRSHEPTKMVIFNN